MTSYSLPHYDTGSGVTPVWKTRDSRTIPFSQMNNAHLINILRKFGLENCMNPETLPNDMMRAAVLEALQRGLIPMRPSVQVQLGDHVESKKKKKPSHIREGSLLDHQLMKIGAL